MKFTEGERGGEEGGERGREGEREGERERLITLKFRNVPLIIGTNWWNTNN